MVVVVVAGRFSHGKNYTHNPDNNDWKWVLPCHFCGGDVEVGIAQRGRYHIGPGPAFVQNLELLYCESCVVARAERAAAVKRKFSEAEDSRQQRPGSQESDVTGQE